MKSGWVRMYRDEDDPYWNEEREFSKWEAWCDLVLSARYQDGTSIVTIGNQVYICNRGQCIRTTRGLAKRWGWSLSRVVRFLDTTRRMNRIQIDSGTDTGTKVTRITICDYDSYSGSRNGNGTALNTVQNAAEDRNRFEYSGEYRSETEASTDPKHLTPCNSDTYKASRNRCETDAKQNRNGGEYSNEYYKENREEETRIKNKSNNCEKSPSPGGVTDVTDSTLLGDNDGCADDDDDFDLFEGTVPKSKPPAKPERDPADDVPDDFEAARQLYRDQLCSRSVPGKLNAWTQFKKAHKDWRTAQHNLLPAVESLITWRKAYQRLVDAGSHPEYGFLPSAQNWGTYVGPKRHWENELVPIPGMNGAKAITKNGEPLPDGVYPGEQQQLDAMETLWHHIEFAAEWIQDGYAIENARGDWPDAFEDTGELIGSKERYIEINMERWRQAQ